MPPFQSLTTSWSQGARRDQLKTPEPLSEGEAQPPNAPRPRFRIKRRNVSNLGAPTEQFLASVAAADVPIPSVEEPRVLDEDMVDTIPQFGHIDDISYAGETTERMFSPPKTPAPDAIQSLSPKQFPNWSLESTVSLDSSPEYESSRPSTAHSTHTSASFFSSFSVSSEDLAQCVSPDTHQEARFPNLLSAEDADRTIRAQPATTAKRTTRKAPWTKPMSQHLWSTYMMYLQDPKVTPFRLSKGGIPPPGVCSRVAREAKRSWKGSRPSANDSLGGSLTPTAQNYSTFVQWPHSHASTRAHLLDLCRLNARTAVRDHQYLAHSPTPFGRRETRLYNRFSGQDMAVSLTMSTAESMQPNGPLAQLTSSQPEPHSEELPPPRMGELMAAPGLEPLESERTQLASPFVARSYGHMSSSSVPSSFAPHSDFDRRQVQTDRPRRLRSPVRFLQSKSTQKRRSGQQVGEPRRIKRPSLGSDLWIDPSGDDDKPSSSRAVADFKPASLEELAKAPVPRANLQELFETPQPITPKKPRAAPMEDPPRLGSPFSLSSSMSFPNRLYGAPGVDIGSARRPFATVQQSTNNASTPRSSLNSRLAYLDERLKEFRQRDHSRRRSESPL